MNTSSNKWYQIFGIVVFSMALLLGFNIYPALAAPESPVQHKDIRDGIQCGTSAIIAENHGDKPVEKTLATFKNGCNSESKIFVGGVEKLTIPAGESRAELNFTLNPGEVITVQAGDQGTLQEGVCKGSFK